MNTCKCGRVVSRAGSQCMSCDKKKAWQQGDHDDQRERLRTRHSGRAERLSYALKERCPAEPRSAIDNAVRDAFRAVVGFDPLRERNPAWVFPRQIDGATDGT